MLNTALIKGRVVGLVPTEEHVKALVADFQKFQISDEKGAEFLELWADKNAYSLALPEFKELLTLGYSQTDIKQFLDNCGIVAQQVSMPFDIGMKLWDVALKTPQVFNDVIRIAIRMNQSISQEFAEGLFLDEEEIFSQEIPWSNTTVEVKPQIAQLWKVFIQDLEERLKKSHQGIFAALADLRDELLYERVDQEEVILVEPLESEIEPEIDELDLDDEDKKISKENAAIEEDQEDELLDEDD